MTSDLRLVINETMFKRAAQRLKHQWPAALTLTQAKHTLAKTLGFEDYDHLQRALPAVPIMAGEVQHSALTTLMDRLLPWVRKEGGVLVQWETSSTAMPQTDIRGTFLPLDFGLSQEALFRLLDIAAGGQWNRQTPLSLRHGEVQVTFLFRPWGTPLLTVVALPAEVACSSLAVISDHPGVHALIRTHHTGRLLHLGPAGIGKSFAMQASSQDWMRRGVRVGLFDPQRTESSEGYAAPDVARTDHFPKDTTCRRWVLGDMQPGAATRQLSVAFIQEKLHLADAITLAETTHDWVKELQRQITHSRYIWGQELSEAEFRMACHEFLHQLHGVIIHGSLDRWARPALRRGGYLTRADLLLLAEIPRSEWEHRANDLVNPFGYAEEDIQMAHTLRHQMSSTSSA